MIHRAFSRGLLLPDPLDFAWRYVKETSKLSKAQQRTDRGYAIYMGSVPSVCRPAFQARGEWTAAYNMLIWRWNELRRGSGRRRHPATVVGLHPDEAIAVDVKPCAALCVCLARPPWGETAARRFSKWIHGVHEVVLLERRLKYPTESIILPWQIAGAADPIVELRASYSSSSYSGYSCLNSGSRSLLTARIISGVR